MTKFLDILRGLRQCPREFWVMIFLKVVFSYSYFTIAFVLTLYLTSDHGFSDTGAGDMYSTWAVFMSLFQFCSGPIIDMLQIRRSLIFGSLMTTIGGMLLALTFDNVFFIGLALFVFIPMGSAFLLTPVDIGGKRYSKNVDGAINVAFNVFYSGSNLGALIAGMTIESIRSEFGGRGVDFSSRHATTERLTILSGAMATAIGGLVAALVVTDVPLQTQNELEAAASNYHQGFVPATTQPQVGPVQVTCFGGRFRWFFKILAWFKAEVLPILRSRYFSCLLLFTFTLVGVRTVFRYNDTVFPKVVIRALGPETRYGILYSINPLILVFITPFVGAFVAQYDIYNVMLVGTFIAGFSVFIMAIALNLTTVIIWSIVFTIGEAVYSPQTNIYVMAVAPEGREAIYASLVNAPKLLAKIIAGPMSGYELEKYCPKEGPYGLCNLVYRDIGFWACSTFFLLLICKRFIHNPHIAARVNLRLQEGHIGSPE